MDTSLAPSKAVADLIAHDVRVLCSLGRYQEGLQKIAKLSGAFGSVCDQAGMPILWYEHLNILVSLERWEEAKLISCWQSPLNAFALRYLARAYAEAGWLDHARAIIDRIISNHQGSGGSEIGQQLKESDILVPKHRGISRLLISCYSSPSQKPKTKLLIYARAPSRRQIVLTKSSWPSDHGAVLRNARVIGSDWGVYSIEAGAMQYTTFHVNQRMEVAWPPRSTQSVDISLPTIRIPRLTILIGGFHNFYHNLIDYYINAFYFHMLMFRIETGELILRPEVTRPLILIADDEQAFHHQMIDFFNLPAEQLIRLPYGDIAKCAELVVLPRMATGYGHIRDIRPIHWVQDLIRAKCAPTPNKTRLYISRRKASTRRLTNEADLVAALKAFGFQELVLEDLSFKDQLGHFFSAEVVIAPHGAGLANMIASTKHMTVIEILPSQGVIQDYFANLARGLGHRFIRINVNGKIESGDDYQVDLRDVIEVCEQLNLGSDSLR